MQTPAPNLSKLSFAERRHAQTPGRSLQDLLRSTDPRDDSWRSKRAATQRNTRDAQQQHATNTKNTKNTHRRPRQPGGTAFVVCQAASDTPLLLVVCERYEKGSRRPSNNPRWGPPGGGHKEIDGVYPWQTTVRELNEELSTDYRWLTLEGMCHTWLRIDDPPPPTDQPGDRWALLLSETRSTVTAALDPGKLWDIDAQLSADGETCGADWVPLSALEPELMGTTVPLTMREGLPVMLRSEYEQDTRNVARAILEHLRDVGSGCRASAPR